jgi:hypothetical protein
MDSGPDPFLKKPEVRRQTPEEVLLISGFRVLASEGGFPHSEILGSKLVRSSPRLIAAYHVLHRLSAPRHPPNALKALDRSHDRCPPVPQDGGPIRPFTKERTIRKTCLRLSPKTFACLTHPVVQRSDDQRSEIRDRKPSLVCRISPATECVTSSQCQTPARKPKRAAGELPGPVTRPQAQKSRRRISSKTSIITRISDRLPDGAPRITWWSQTGSNRRPHACKARALPTELWPPEVRDQKVRGQTARLTF